MITVIKTFLKFSLFFLVFCFLKCSKKIDKLVIDRDDYKDKLKGFWLGSCIANWTGLPTENQRTKFPFFTDADFGTGKFDYVLDQHPWGADDDTDIEYVYQHAIEKFNNYKLTGQEISSAWQQHIGLPKLWVSNLAALGQMQNGVIPPETSLPENNPIWEMIDAQLTTEIFGVLTPGRPEVGLDLAYLPLRTTAYLHSQWASEFYIIMHSLSYFNKDEISVKEKINLIADEARKILPNDSYSAKMYDYVKEKYQSGITWEAARDSLNLRYQINQMDNYMWATKDESCYGCFAAGINFGASIISLLYGEGDYKKTVKIAALCGWDSDNPAATWGGMLGFIYGAEKIKKLFEVEMSEKYNIHRTRINFSNDGIDDFKNMALKSMKIIEKVVTEKLNGKSDNNKLVLNKI